MVLFAFFCLRSGVPLLQYYALLSVSDAVVFVCFHSRHAPSDGRCLTADAAAQVGSLAIDSVHVEN